MHHPSFFRAVLGRWWALMGSAILTAIGFYALVANKSASWMIAVELIAAVLLFYVAVHGAWNDERIARLEAERSADHAKPNFALEVVDEIHAYTPSGYFFWITNCGERSVRNVTFHPIRSKGSKHYIRLDPQVVLDPHKRTPLTFHCGVEGEPFGILEGNSGRLVLFCDDNPDKAPRLAFDVAIRCLDGDRPLEEHHTLEVSVASTGAKLKIYPTGAASAS
jgi:hypothetical protein